MYTKPLRTCYLPGTIVQYRDGIQKIKTDKGLIPLARHVAALSSKVIGGGKELEPGQKVMHRDMNTFGSEEHDKPENLVVIQMRTTKFQFTLKQSRIVYEPKKLAKINLTTTRGLVMK